MAPNADERFTRIYETYYPAVLAYCARRVSRSDAEDVANEVFVVLWRHVDTFDEESPLPWLYRVAHGSIRNRWKSTRRRFELTRRLSGLPSVSVDPADVVVVRRERDRALLAALGKLRAGDQEVLRLAALQEAPPGSGDRPRLGKRYFSERRDSSTGPAVVALCM
jgi:RNA polymerase sigma-70 factor (ECF subfamily)